MLHTHIAELAILFIALYNVIFKLLETSREDKTVWTEKNHEFPALGLQFVFHAELNFDLSVKSLNI
jgi:hypothetical protein